MLGLSPPGFSERLIGFETTHDRRLANDPPSILHLASVAARFRQDAFGFRYAPTLLLVQNTALPCSDRRRSGASFHDGYGVTKSRTIREQLRPNTT